MYFLMFVPPQTSLQRTLQTLIFGFTAKVFNIHDKHTETDISTALFSGYFIGEATSIQVRRGEVAAHCEKQTQSLSSSHCPFTV